MTLLKADTGRAGYRLVGASLPEEIHNYLTLFTIARGITKTKILKDLLESWIDSQQEKDSDEALIKKIVHRANAQWRTERTRRRNPKTFDKFRHELYDELVYKGLTDYHINQILEGIKE